MAATWKDTTKRITVYPASGQTGVPVSFNRCQEHPTPFGGTCDPAHPTQPVGYVVTIQADGYYAMKIEGIAFSKGAARTPVDPVPGGPLVQLGDDRPHRRHVRRDIDRGPVPADREPLVAPAGLDSRMPYSPISPPVPRSSAGFWKARNHRVAPDGP
jgi:hypothetical protein